MARGDEFDDPAETVEIERVEHRGDVPPPGAPPAPGGPPGDAAVEEGVVHEHETVRPRADGSVERDVVRHEQRRRMSGDRIALIVLLLVLLAAAGVGAWWYFTQEDTVDVPSVEGLQVAEAVTRLEAEGLEADVNTEASDAPEGTVFEQDPAAGTEVDEGSTVDLRASGGPEEISVPNAVGLSEEVARERLVNAGFEVQTREVFSDREPGTVVDQDPAAGARAAEGATVTIEVSKGTGEVEVPNVVGLSRAEAEDEIESADLVPNVVEVPSAEPEGTVVAQNPAGGTAMQGSNVRLNVSSGQLPEQPSP